MQTLCTSDVPMHAPTATDRMKSRKRLAASDRREQLLCTAASQFAKTGLHATTTAALAEAAGVSEPTLYVYFPDKESMFKEVVRRNSEARLKTLEARMTSVVASRPRGCIQAMLEAAVSACISAAGGPLLTSWALLEAPEFAADLQRQEIGLISIVCEKEFAARFPDERRIPSLSAYLISFSMQACYSYGFWLGAMRHTPETAAPLVQQFAAGAAESVLGLIRAARRRVGRSKEAHCEPSSGHHSSKAR